MFDQDIYTIHGESSDYRLAATICDTDRMIVDKYLSERDENPEDSSDFRSMRSMMQGNKGVRI